MFYFRFLLVAIVPVRRCQLFISSPIYRLEMMLMGAIWMAGWKDRWIDRCTIIVRWTIVVILYVNIIQLI